MNGEDTRPLSERRTKFDVANRCEVFGELRCELTVAIEVGDSFAEASFEFCRREIKRGYKRASRN